MKKRILSICMVIALFLNWLPQIILPASANVMQSGKSKEGFTWSLDSEGTLTISGTGAMKDYYSAVDGSASSWLEANLNEYINQIKKVIINPGITHIGNFAFTFCDLESVEIPDTVVSIGECAFDYCTRLKSVVIPKNVAHIDRSAFLGCEELDSITFMGNAPIFGNGFGQDIFEEIPIFAYYPQGNTTWTPEVMQNYGGILTWVPLADEENMDSTTMENGSSLFIPVVESRIEESRYYSLDPEEQQECKGLLFDIDKNGQEELVLQYVYRRSVVYEIWTVANGRPQCVLDDPFYYGSISPMFYLVTHNGENYLVLNDHSAGSDGSGSHWYFFLLAGGTYQKVYSLNEYWFEGTVEYSFKNEEISENEFTEILDYIRKNETIIPLHTDGVTLPEMIDHLKRKNVQEGENENYPIDKGNESKDSGVIDRLENNSNSSSDDSEKRLVQLNSYWDGEMNSTYLYYDDYTGLLDRIEFSYNDDYDYKPSDWFYEYDEFNRLVKIESRNKEENFYDYVYLEFIYDANGRIIKWKEFSPGLGDWEGDCVYDSAGRLIWTEGNWSAGYAETSDFTYDVHGSLLEVVQTQSWIDYENVTVTKYRYDSQKRVSSKTINKSYGTDIEKYLYDYDPFVIIQKGNEIEAYYDLGYLSNMNVHLAHSFYGKVYGRFSDFCELEKLEADDDGYLEVIEGTVNDGSNVVKSEFIWETVEDDDKAESTDDSAYENYARTEWIKQHMEYAIGDEYDSQIVSGYNGRMLAVFRDALNDNGIKNYRLAKNTSRILGLDFELSETEMYELILAEILYSKAGLGMGEEAYKVNYNTALQEIAKLLVTTANVADNSSKIPKDAMNSIQEMYALFQTMNTDSADFKSVLSKIVKLIDENVKQPDLVKGFKSDATFTALGIVVDGLFEEYDALEDIVQYMANYTAYQATSRQLKEVLMRLSVVVFYEYQGLAGVGELDELGLWDAMVNWSAFGEAIISFMKVLTDYEQKSADAVAAYAVERMDNADKNFNNKAFTSILVFGLDTIASQVPVLNALVVAKNVLNVGVLVTKVISNVDEREYALDMLTKIYCISIALDKAVNDCADAMTEDDFYASTVFDESVNVYSRTQLLASDYALKYADMILANAKEDLYDYDSNWGIDHLFRSREEMVAIVERYSNFYKILEEQRSEIKAIACHNSDLRYDPATDEIIYDFKDSRIYIVACPVDVIVENEIGEQIAYLSGEQNEILDGYEFYFHTIKIPDDSGEYIKVAVVPKNYQIDVKGTDDGIMHAFVADYTTDDATEVETYFNIPIEKGSMGYFEVSTSNDNVCSLVMDQIVYSNMKTVEDLPANSENDNTWIWTVLGIAVVGVMVQIFIMKRKKSDN